MKLIELFTKDDAGPDYNVKPMQGDAEAIAKTISTNCKEMLAAYKANGVLLLRGIGDLQGTKVLGVSANIRPDRKPSAMPQEHHDLMSDAMDELDLPSRRNSLICSNEKREASAWGPVYIVFVKDGWDGFVLDGHDFDDLYVRADPIVRAKGQPEEQIASMKKVITGLRPVHFKTSTDLNKVLSKPRPEILIRGASYYGIKANMDEAQEVLKLLNITAKNL